MKNIKAKNFCFDEFEDLKNKRITSWVYVPSFNKIIAGSQSGDLLILFLDDDGTSIECHKVENISRYPIVAMSLSTDNSKILVIAGSAEDITLFSFDSDTLHQNHSLDLNSVLIEDKQVDVGWGSRETQFKSTDERNSKEITNGVTNSVIAIQSNNVDNIVSKSLLLEPKVSWGLDSSYFAVSVEINTQQQNTYGSAQNKRSIIIYNSECEPQASIEKTATGLGNCLDWGSTGLAELIAIDQDLYGKKHISFFEKNGLRHTGFELKDLKYNTFDIFQISWNCDASILAVWINKGSHGGAVQFYMTKNYNWTLKFEISTRTNEKFDVVKWDVNDPLVIYTIDSLGYITKYKFSLECIGSDNSLLKFNPAMVCVIDGSELKLTPFSLCCIPPPYTASSVKLSEGLSILNASFYVEESLVAILTRKSINIAKDTTNLQDISDNKQIMYDDDSFRVIFSMNLPEIIQSPIQIIMRKKSELILLDCSEYDYSDVYLIKLECKDFNVIPSSIGKIGRVMLPAKLARLSEKVCIVDGKGMLFSVEESNNPKSHFLESLNLKFPKFVSKFAFFELRDPYSNSEMECESVFVGLSEDKKLYINEVLHCSSCSSFNISNKFIAYTTYENRLITGFLDLKHAGRKKFHSSGLDAFIYMLKEAELSSRKIERGATIVAISEEKQNLILQMPRGNLECVQPKAFVLHQISKCMDRMDYYSAYMIARKGCIDMNILIDINPEGFMRSHTNMITQIDEPRLLNVFISALKDDDVTRTLYDGIYFGTNDNEPYTFENKLDEVCSLLEASLNDIDKKKYLTSLITLDLVKKPPQYGKAMLRIAEIMESISDRVCSRQLTEEAIDYMVSMEDVSYLYKAALGTYNLNLALAVAVKSQNDPRDYVPFINSLRFLPEYYKMFKINKHLDQCEKAVENLINYLANDQSAGSKYYDMLQKYIIEKKAYLHAYKFLLKLGLPHMRDTLMWVCKHYAEYLSINSNYKEAGLFYELSLEKSLSINMYTKCLYWEKVLELANEAEYSDENIKTIAFDLVKRLSDVGRYAEAANICLIYLDKKDAIEHFMNDKKWKFVLCLCSTFGYLDYKIDTVIPGIKSAIESCTSGLKLLELQIKHLCKSIVDHRHKKETSAADCVNGEISDDISELSSEISDISLISALKTDTSCLTSSSISSRRTAKSTMKALRKRAMGKDPFYVEEYLLNNLKTTCAKINDLSLETESLLNVCIPCVGYMPYTTLLNTHCSLLKEVEHSLDIIFPPNPPEEPLSFSRPELVKIVSLKLL